MAFAGVHVVCGYLGGLGFRGTSRPDVINNVSWTEGVATATLSTNAAPAYSEEYGSPVFVIYAVADTWFAYGAAPDQTANPRVLVKAGTPTTIMVEPGDKFKWVAA